MPAFPGVTCGTCAFIDLTNVQQPFCRRNPPSLVVVKTRDVKDEGVRKFWPVVNPVSDWCGEHRTVVKD